MVKAKKKKKGEHDIFFWIHDTKTFTEINKLYSLVKMMNIMNLFASILREMQHPKQCSRYFLQQKGGRELSIICIWRITKAGGQIPLHTLLEFAEVPGIMPFSQRSEYVLPQQVSESSGHQKWPIRAVKTLRGRVEDAERPKLEDGHLMMNWEVTGSRYLHRRREESEIGVGCQTQRQD